MYAVACILVFGSTYREEDIMRPTEGLDPEDITMILIVGAVGLINLLPYYF
jgi:hypothetical protein